MSAAVLSVYNCEYVDPTNRLDGDTFRCTGNVVPIAPDVKVWEPKVRVVRINAPESGDPGANEARAALVAWLRAGRFNLICYGRDKYGRLLADAERGSGLLSQYMLDRDLVEPMTIKKAQNLTDDQHLALAVAA